MWRIRDFNQALKIMKKMAMIQFGLYYSILINSIFDIPRKMGADLIMSVLGSLTVSYMPFSRMQGRPAWIGLWRQFLPTT